MNRETPADVEVVRADTDHTELIVPLFDAYRQFYRLPPDPEGARAFLARRLADTSSVIFVASLESGASPAPAGFTQLYPSFSSLAMRPVWILYDLFVTPEARRKGIGAALLRRARDFAAETGAAELSLQTAIDNYPAQALYEALGWRRDTEFYTYNLPL